MLRFGFGVSLLPTLAWLTFSSGFAHAQGQALPPIKINLPPTPNFDVGTAPIQHPTGEMSVYGLRKAMSKYLDKDVRVKGYLLMIYECPAELRKCNDEAASKAKRARPSAPPKGGVPGKGEVEGGGCRPCDQPHFFIGDTPTTRLERGLLVADYPVKDKVSGRPKSLNAKLKEPYVVTGTFSMNSATGFASSNGLLVHKKLEDVQGKVVLEGNAVLPEDAQGIQLDGKAVTPKLR